MDVPPAILKCVAFVACLDKDEGEKIAGTCFFISRPSRWPSLRFGYIITARHVIEGIRDAGYDPLLRMNLVHSGKTLVTLTRPWIFHPDNDVDIAITMQPTEEEMGEEEDDHLNLPWTIIEPEQINAQDPRDFAVGEDVFISGLFYQHAGRARNVPIIRLGSIAALPEEPVCVTVGSPYHPREAFVDAYLIETRSQSGLSGSPAFVVETNISSHGRLVTHGDVATPRSNRPIFLLGLLSGGFNPKGVDLEAPGKPQRVNVGVSVVVPYYRILEMFECPEVIQYEADLLAAHERQNSATTDEDAEPKEAEQTEAGRAET